VAQEFLYEDVPIPDPELQSNSGLGSDLGAMPGTASFTARLDVGFLTGGAEPDYGIRSVHMIHGGTVMKVQLTHTWPLRRTSIVGLVAAMAIILGGCDDLLDVELPGQVTESGVFDPAQATILVNSAASAVECAYSDFVATNAAGNEDVLTRDTGWWGGSHEFATTTGTGSTCNSANTGYAWWNPMHAGRYLAEEAYRHLDEVWEPAQVAGDRDRLLAESAIWAGVAYGLFGEHFCEMAFDGGELLTADETLGAAEEWLTTALGHLGATGDFAIPGGTSPSAVETARLLRSRIRLARGNEAGAASDADAVSQGFMAWITRDGGGTRQRWNKVFNGHNEEQINTVIGAVDWWSGSGTPNPATGEPWPDVIPFTGYRDLGILPDGRAVTDEGHAITTATPDAIADPRVHVIDEGRVFTEHPVWRQQKYLGLGDDIPLANWEEAWLIIAKIQGGQEAVNRVNDIRDHHDLPRVDYVDPNDADQVREMVLEEERRSLFLEGRWWSTKIQERLWFPRGVGQVQPPTAYGYLGGVRMIMPSGEYDLNPNFDASARATGCVAIERPVI
jgi:hypothetical protein